MSGFEVFFWNISPELKSKTDLLVAVIHWQCIQKGFLCVGTGEEFAAYPETGWKLLPTGWNGSQMIYVIRYENKESGQKLIIKCVNMSEDVFEISASIIGDYYSVYFQIKPNDYITDSFQTLEGAFVSGSVDEISQVIETKLINKVVNPIADRSTNTFDTNSRQRQPDFDYDPLRVGPIQSRTRPRPRTDLYYDPTQGGQWPPPYGGADLDPLGEREGGMLMDPRNFPIYYGRNPAPRLPRGAVPPGARFDPFGPPGRGPVRSNRDPRYAAPDPDHLPPPGYHQRQPDFEYDPLRVGPSGPLHNPYAFDPYYDPTQGGQWPPPYGGTSPLDPLGRRQGGMLMDPRNSPRPSGGPRNPAPGLPRGAILPGARFDPYGPPGRRSVRPNRDPRYAAPDPNRPAHHKKFM